jgi:hypothetical protein
VTCRDRNPSRAFASSKIFDWKRISNPCHASYFGSAAEGIGRLITKRIVTGSPRGHKTFASWPVKKDEDFA